MISFKPCIPSIITAFNSPSFDWVLLPYSSAFSFFLFDTKRMMAENIIKISESPGEKKPTAINERIGRTAATNICIKEWA